MLWKKGLAALLALILLLTPAVCAAQVQQSDLIEAAFTMLEEGNPFAARYEKLTGRKIDPLFPQGVPYYFGGIAKPSGTGYFYISYPHYFVKVCEKSSAYFRKGMKYLYGVDCSGFARYVCMACGKQQPPALSVILTDWNQRPFQVYASREGCEAPPFGQLHETLQVGDMLVIRHGTSEYRHIMMYIGTPRDFGYTAEEEPALADWLDYPLVIHCGTNPFCGERFQNVIDSNPERYGQCLTTDGGVAVSILGPAPEEAPEHGHLQEADFDWFEMKDGGYRMTVINMTDVKDYCWYRPQERKP